VEGVGGRRELNKKVLSHVKSTIYWVEFQVYRNCHVRGELQNSTKEKEW
jgi:hypothetical protein